VPDGKYMNRGPTNIRNNPQGAKESSFTVTDKKSVLIRLGKYMLRYKWLLVLALVCTVSANLFALLTPKLSGYAITVIETGGIGGVNFKKVLYYIGLMMLVNIVSAVLSYFLSVLMITISRKVIFDMRKDIFDKLMTLPVGFFDTNLSGDIISRISYDTDTINASLSSDLVQVLASSITIVGSFIMMLSISPRLVLVFVLTVPLSVLMTDFISKHTRPLFRRRSIMLGELNGFVEEKVSGQKTLKAYNREKYMIDKFDTMNDEVVEAYYKADYYGTMMGPCVNFINNLSLVLITVFGAILYMSGGMLIGDISAFVLYSRKFSGPINEIAQIYGELQSALAAAERVFKLLDTEAEPSDAIDAIDIVDVEGDVEFRDVSFGYDKNKTIIHNLSFKAEPGSLTAIVGPTGAGKTTLINLLMRFYDIDGGIITLDQNNIQLIKRNSLRRSYSMVLQETWLFYGTVYENIAYGSPGATLEEVKEAAQAAKIHSYIMSLPLGYDTIITDDGANISKGQKQLLTIARAMLIKSNMLILDEATSNVDTRTELMIQSAMRELMKDKTCFVVAHRLSTIRGADNILVIKNGDVVESGTHEELMAKNGFYREMHDAQYT